MDSRRLSATVAALVGAVSVMSSMGNAEAAPTSANDVRPTSGALVGKTDRIDEYIPESAPEPVLVLPAAAASVTLSVDDSGTFSGTVVDGSAQPVDGAAVQIVASAAGEQPITAVATSNAYGAYAGTLALPSGTFTIVATSDGIESVPVVITRSAVLDVSVVAPAVRSETVVPITVALRDRGVAADGNVTLWVKEAVGPWKAHFRGRTTGGSLRVNYRAWLAPTVRVDVSRSGQVARAAISIRTLPPFPAARQPASAPQPRQRFPVVAPPVGRGAAPAISRIPGSIWRSMRGLSWRPGCTPYRYLRLIRVNYRGFDGYRHRGQLVVSSSIARKTASMFAGLYRIGFPIRQMRLVDAYGPMRGRPGANDYASMAADNTSGFNCRYVVGKESSRVRSPHASGRSIDINPWENPYVARTGVYPNSWYLWRSAPSVGMWKPGSAQLSIARRARCSWGGSYRDYHHFDC